MAGDGYLRFLEQVFAPEKGIGIEIPSPQKRTRYPIRNDSATHNDSPTQYTSAIHVPRFDVDIFVDEDTRVRKCLCTFGNNPVCNMQGNLFEPFDQDEIYLNYGHLMKVSRMDLKPVDDCFYYHDGVNRQIVIYDRRMEIAQNGCAYIERPMCFTQAVTIDDASPGRSSENRAIPRKIRQNGFDIEKDYSYTANRFLKVRGMQCVLFKIQPGYFVLFLLGEKIRYVWCYNYVWQYDQPTEIPNLEFFEVFLRKIKSMRDDYLQYTIGAIPHHTM